MSSAAAITIVFALIERFAEEKDIKEIDEIQELDLSDLPELPEEEKQPGKLGVSIEIIFGALGIAFFTYVQETGGLVPYFINPGSEMRLVPFFTENFVKFIPVMIALAGLDLTRNLTILVQGHHSSLTSWWEICTKAANVVYLGFLINYLPLVTLEGFAEIFDTSDLAKLGSMTNTGIAIAIGLGIFGSVIEIVKKVVRELKNPVL